MSYFLYSRVVVCNYSWLLAKNPTVLYRRWQVSFLVTIAVYIQHPSGRLYLSFFLFDSGRASVHAVCVKLTGLVLIYNQESACCLLLGGKALESTHWSGSDLIKLSRAWQPVRSHPMGRDGTCHSDCGGPRKSPIAGSGENVTSALYHPPTRNIRSIGQINFDIFFWWGFNQTL